MKYSKIIQYSKQLQELGAPIEAFLRDVQIIWEYYSIAEKDKTHDLGTLGKLRWKLSEKNFISLETVEAALYGSKLKKVRTDLIRQIRKELSQKRISENI